MSTSTNNVAPLHGGNPPMPPASASERLPYENPATSVHRNATTDTARAQMDDRELHIAKQGLFHTAIDSIKVNDNTHVPLEQLDPKQSAKAAIANFVSATPLNRPPASFEELDGRISDLVHLSDVDHPSPHRRDLVEASQSACQALFEPIEETLTELAGRNPNRTDELIKKAAAYLDDVDYPTPSKKPLLSLRNLQDGHTAIWSNPQAIPDHKRADIDQRILLESQGYLTSTLKSLAIAATNAEHRVRVHHFRRFMSQLSDQTLKATHTIDSVRQRLAEAATRSAHRQTHDAPDTFVLLGGPAASSVAPMLIDNLQTTPAELPHRIMAQLIAAMHDIAKTRHGVACQPQPGPLFSLLSPEEVLSAFHSLVDVHLAENNFYAEVRKFGVEKFALELYCKAQPRAHFARQSPALGLDFFEDSIATFPVPTGPEDKQTLSEIRLALPDVSIRLVRSQPNSCRLTRRLAGFPFCALAANAALSQSYAAASKYNHLPHVVGILPDVTDGRPSKALVDFYSPPTSQE